jgi:predicted nucleic acid-binding protein
VKRIMVDVNVVLDALLDRRPHAASAIALWERVELGAVQALIPAHGVTTIYYLAARQRDATFARRVVADLLTVFGVAPVDGKVLHRALTLASRDFEDAVCAAAAEASKCDTIVTRDPGGFPTEPIALTSADAMVAWLDHRAGSR